MEHHDVARLVRERDDVVGLAVGLDVRETGPLGFGVVGGGLVVGVERGPRVLGSAMAVTRRPGSVAPARALAAAIFAAPVAWLVFQQGEGTLAYLACAAAGPPIGLVIGLAAV